MGLGKRTSLIVFGAALLFHGLTHGIDCASLLNSPARAKGLAQKFAEQNLLQEAALINAANGNFAAAARIEKTIETALRDQPIVSIVRQKSENSAGHSKSYVVQLQNGMKAVFKPGYYGWPFSLLKWQPHAVSMNAEVAAYKIDRLLGLNIVPVTVFRRVRGQMGSLQAFVHGTERNVYTSYRSMTLFDFLINNNDRGYRNYLVLDGHTVAIDHGAALFMDRPAGREIGVGYFVKATNVETRQDRLANKRFLEALLTKGTPDALLEILMSLDFKPNIIQMVMKRRELIVEVLTRTLEQKSHLPTTSESHLQGRPTRLPSPPTETTPESHPETSLQEALQ